MKLLIVEDETRLADLLREGLTEEGRAIASHAIQRSAPWMGLALAKGHEFDVIILDVMMSKFNGYDWPSVCGRRKSEPQY
jgi:DNA-binding response OmpR family regulator